MVDCNSDFEYKYTFKENNYAFGLKRKKTSVNTYNSVYIKEIEVKSEENSRVKNCSNQIVTLFARLKLFIIKCRA